MKSIFCPNLDAIRGKNGQAQPQPATTHHIDIPQVIRERNRDVEISAGVLFINDLPFIVKWSRRL
jgi:hypothetical protein